MSETPRPWAVVTGASSGIGLELARLCARGGHDVVLVARNRPQLDELAKYLSGMYGVCAEVIELDLGDPEAPAALLEEVARRGITVEVLVNNAGFGVYGPVHKADPDRQVAMLQVNVTALTDLTCRVLPGMVARGRGRILNVASTSGFAPGPLMAVYSAAKAYVVSFSEAVAFELAGTGVTVTALCPGPVRTPFHARAGRGRGVLHDSPAMLDPAPVALAGYRGMMQGRRLVIPGWLNRVMAFLPRLMPRGAVLRSRYRFQLKLAE